MVFDFIVQHQQNKEKHLIHFLLTSKMQQHGLLISRDMVK